MTLGERCRQALGTLHQKMVREKLPPEDIAAGWALGVCIGFAIPFGLQLIIAIPLAIMCRISKLGASLGTFVSNPVTCLLLYPTQTYVTSRILFGEGSLSFERLVETSWSWEAVRRLGAEAMVSFFLGGMFLAIVATPITYFTVKRLVVRHRRRMAEKGGR